MAFCTYRRRHSRERRYNPGLLSPRFYGDYDMYERDVEDMWTYDRMPCSARRHRPICGHDWCPFHAGEYREPVSRVSRVLDHI